MKLALRKTHATGANWLARLAAWAIKARLVSQYCHAGIVVDGNLSHATPSDGLHVTPAADWQPDKWVLIDCGETHADFLKFGLMFYSNAKYDWPSLLLFIGIRVHSNKHLYCFEWCWFVMTGDMPTTRITPEMLIEKAYQLAHTPHP